MSLTHDQAMSVRQRRSSDPGVALGSPGSLPLLGLLALVCLVGQPGCQAVQNRMTQRSEHCGELCAQARAACEKGDAAQANRCINEALRQRPSDTETRRQLAETMWASDRQEEAIAEYLMICEDHPAEVKLAERLAVMQWEARHRFAAANTALAVLRLDPSSREALLIRARHDAEQGKLDDALVSYIKLSQIDPHDPVTLKELGELHLKRGQPDRATPLLRAALSQSQMTPESRAEIEWLLGMAYVQSDRWSMAVELLENAVVHRRPTADDWCLVGLAHLRTGNVESARADLRRASESEPPSEATRQLAEQLQADADLTAGDRAIVPVSYRPK